MSISTPFTSPNGFAGDAAGLTNIPAANITGQVAASAGGTGVSRPGTSGNVLTSNGTAWLSQAIPPNGLQGAMVVLTSGISWTVPAGITKIKATAVGGGGGHQLNLASNTGGGGGGTAVKYFSVTPGESITYTVGAAGAIGCNGGDTTVTVNDLTITGGGGSVSSGSEATFASGGIATSGDLNIQGSSGGGTDGGLTIGGGSLFGTGGRVNSSGNTTDGVGYGAGAAYLGTGVMPTQGVVIIEY